MNTLPENYALLGKQFDAFTRTAIAIMRQLNQAPVEPNENLHTNIAEIQRVVCDYYHLPLSAMQSPMRTATYAKARHVAMMLSRELTKQGVGEIAECFSRTHGMVSHAINGISNRLSTEPDFRDEYQLIRSRCENALRNLTMPLFTTA